MNSEKPAKLRPYWHVDAKWIFGILFTLCLTTTLTLFSLATLLSQQVGIPIATYVVASQFSKDGLDDTKDIEKFKQKNTGSGETIFHPLPGQNATITNQDLETLSPREIRLKIFLQVVEPIYHQKQTEETLKQFGILAFLNYETHDLTQRAFLFSIIPLILTGVGLIAFSYSYGRLISPSVVFLLVSTIPSLFLFLIQHITPAPSDKGLSSIIPNDLLKIIADHIVLPYYLVFILGAGLLLLTAATKLFMKRQRQEKIPNDG